MSETFEARLARLEPFTRPTLALYLPGVVEALALVRALLADGETVEAARHLTHAEWLAGLRPVVDLDHDPAGLPPAGEIPECPRCGDAYAPRFNTTNRARIVGWGRCMGCGSRRSPAQTAQSQMLHTYRRPAIVFRFGGEAR